MESMNIKDIVKLGVGNKKHVDNIIDNFKKIINRDIPRRQEENLQKLASLFLNEVKINKPIVVNLGIGQGKSTLLLEFIKYMYELDSTLSTVIVKRTLQEGRDFCINTGLRNNESIRNWVDSSDDPVKRLQDLYHGDTQDYNQSGYADEFPHEDVFIARLLRGFNYKDCLKYEDPTPHKMAIGKLPVHYRDYSPILCRNCERTCGAKLSKWTVDKHPAMVITHQRLFLSNDSDDITESIVGRKILIIDEKIESKDIGDILLEQWEAILTKVVGLNLSDEIKGEFKKVGLYLNGLQYPDKSSDDPMKIPEYDPLFKFDSTVYGMLMMEDQNDFKNLVAIEKFLIFGGTTNRRWDKEDKKQLSYIRYINLENYTKHFEKTIILDATSVRNGEALDEDYIKSNVILLGGLYEPTLGKINLYHSSQSTTKTSLIIRDNTKTKKDDKQVRNRHGDNKFYQNNIELIANEIQDIISATNEKTLIICYKSIQDSYGVEFKLEVDLNNRLKNSELKSTLYTVRHFGAATTGVNDFRGYKNIVFIGLLNKGKLYYENKKLAIGSSNAQHTERSEHVIDCIQQIGRICVREGKDANVYMIFNDKLGVTEELTKHFTVHRKPWYPKYFNGVNTATVSQLKNCWYAIIKELKKMNEGDKLSFNDLQDKLKSDFKADTVYREVKEHMEIHSFMQGNNILYNKDKRIFMKKFAEVQGIPQRPKWLQLKDQKPIELPF